MKALHILTAQFVNLQVTFVEDETASKYHVDTIKEYAHEIMSLGLLLMEEFNDAIREGDGSRNFRCWCFFLLVFKAADRKITLLKHSISFHKRNTYLAQGWQCKSNGAEQLMYMGDLGRTFQLIYIHMEHLNRECKQAISGLGANITDASIQHIGKCIGRLCSTLLSMILLTL